MPVYIVEVMNDTSGLLHYENDESGLKFDVNPTSKNGPGPSGDGGYVSTSKYQSDTVPYKGSNKYIKINVEGGPKFWISDYYHFAILSTKPPQKLSGSFDSGEKFVMKVDNNEVTFIKYNEGLRASDSGHVPLSSITARAAQGVGNALLAIHF